MAPKASIDHRENFSTPLKDQKDFPVCWAFALLGLIEMLQKNKFNVIKTYSAQELVDKFTPGCKEGLKIELDDVLKFISYFGLALEQQYPFVGANENLLRTLLRPRFQALDRYWDVDKDPKSIIEALRSGPLLIEFIVGRNFMSHETWDIFDPLVEEYTKETTMNHVMILMGAKTTSRGTKLHWLVKDSNGDRWGMKGYGRVSAKMPTHRILKFEVKDGREI